MSAIEEAKVVKYNLYPDTDPTGYAVGFEIKVRGGNKFYVDTIIPLEDARDLSSADIAYSAWNRIKSNVRNRSESLRDSGGILGYVVESSNRIPDGPPNEDNRPEKKPE